MFGASMFRDMEDDPFFSMHNQHMRHMRQMFSNPFGMMAQDPFALSLTDGSEQQQGHRGAAAAAARPGRDVVPHDPMGMGFGGIFGHMNHMMGNMNQMMAGMHRPMQQQVVPNDPNSQFYSQSTVMSYSNTGQGQPRVYQATTSTRQAPGGVRETRKAVRDSETGVEKMAMGRHLGERGHVMERSRNARTGDSEENQEFINLDDTEADHFNNEWKERTRQYSHSQHASLGQSRPHHRHRAIADHSRSPYSRQAPLAIEGAAAPRRPAANTSQSDYRNHPHPHTPSRTHKN